MNQSPVKTQRIDVVDALRGFAVMAILLVHSVEHFIYPVYPENSPVWLVALDEGVFHAVFALFAGKSYAIFALLFGFTFYIQQQNQKKRGKDFGYRFLWRLLLLALFATLNAAFFPAGDVLLLFSIVGIVLFLARNLSDRVVLITAIFFLLQPVEWFHFIANQFNASHTLPELNVGAMYAQVGDVVKSGNIKDFFLTNIALGQKASLFWAIDAGRFFQTAGLFLLGYYIARKELFISTPHNNDLWLKILIVAAIAFSPLYALKELIVKSDVELIRQTAGTAFDMWQKLAFTFVLIASFVLLYQKARFQKAVSSFRLYGKMSLTNYVTQSIAGAFIFFPIGLHLAPYSGYTLSLLIGFVVLILQVSFCKWWLTTHRQGPLERLWHRWTWLGKTSN